MLERSRGLFQGVHRHVDDHLQLALVVERQHLSFTSRAAQAPLRPETGTNTPMKTERDSS